MQRKRGTPREALKRQTIDHYADLTKPLADAHPDEYLVDVDAEFALAWLLWPDGPDDKDRRWTHNGARALFKFAVLNGVIPVNPFNGLRLRGTKGRADLEVLPNEVFERLADVPLLIHGERYGMMWRAILLLLGRVGLRPAELYGLRRTDFDVTAGVVTVERQFVHTIGDYELRHFCGSYLFNDLELPAEAVAQQLGHTDGGALVRKLYGHPDEELQRRRIADAFAHRGAANVAALPAQRPSMSTR